jgi:TPP-dependent 2-oxoacid decarboxylase
MPKITPAARFASAADTKGIVPPMLRAISHISFVAMQAMAEINIETFTVPNEDYTHEIDRSIQQWDLVVRPVYINEATVKVMRDISGHFNDLRASVATNNRQELFDNATIMINEICSLGVLIDTAAWGLKYPEDTDAGREL